MSDVIRVANGAAPWQPTTTSTIVETFNFYDQPLQGIIEQDGCLYLFDCLYGHVDGLSLWLYSLVQQSEAVALLASESDEDFERIRSEIHSSEPGLLAIAVDDYGIIVSGTVENVPSDMSPMVSQLVSEYRSTVQRLSSHTNEAEELEGSDKSHLIPVSS